MGWGYTSGHVQFECDWPRWGVWTVLEVVEKRFLHKFMMVIKPDFILEVLNLQFPAEVQYMVSYNVYVVVQFYPQFNFYFLFFGGMVMSDNEFETKENKN